MRKPSLTDRLEYIAFSGVSGATGRLSSERAESLGASLGRFAYRTVRVRRDLVHEHLRHAFPERGDDWRAQVAEAAYAHVGREFIRALRLSHATREEVVASVRHEIGRDRFYEAVHAGKGVVLVAGHIGNWELGAASVAAQGYPLDAIYQPARNPLFNAAVVRARSRLGVELIPRAQARRDAGDRLRQGRIVCFVSDQNAGRSGVFVPFFGRLASTHRGAALLAVRTGAPLFLGAAVRDGDHYLGITEEIKTPREGPLEDVIRRLTAAYTAELETLVRQWPEQYFWLHRRWKTRPPPDRKGQG